MLHYCDNFDQVDVDVDVEVDVDIDVDVDVVVDVDVDIDVDVDVDADVDVDIDVDDDADVNVYVDDDDDGDVDGGTGVTTEDDGVKEPNAGKNISPADSTVAKLVVISLSKILSPSKLYSKKVEICPMIQMAFTPQSSEISNPKIPPLLRKWREPRRCPSRREMRGSLKE